MALNIHNDETEDLANELAKLMGKTKTEAVKKALAARPQKLKQQQDTQYLTEELNEIAKLPVLDNRGAEEIRYDGNGLP